MVYKIGYIFTDLPQGLQERIYIHRFIAGSTREDIYSQIYRRVYKRGYIFTDLLQGLQERIYIQKFTARFTRKDTNLQIYHRFTREDIYSKIYRTVKWKCCHKLNPYILLPDGLRSTTLGRKNIEIRKSEFVAKTQFLSYQSEKTD